MDTIRVLEDAGFSDSESRAYVALLKNGDLTAYSVSQITGIERTLVYRTLARLIQKGVVAFYDENKIKKFRALPPKKILLHMEEKCKNLKSVLPQFNSMGSERQDEIKVEVYRGLEGIKGLIDELRSIRKDYSVILASKKIDSLSIFFSKLMKILEEENIKERVLLPQGMQILKSKNSILRYLQGKFVYSSTMGVCGDRFGIITSQEPFFAVTVQNKAVAETFQSYFDILWQCAAKH